MVMRLLDRWLGRDGGADARPLRPNELRREQVRAERLRRPARPPQPAVGPPPRRAEAADATTSQPRSPGDDRDGLAAALGSRSGLRRAWLLGEVLGPPTAFRTPRNDW